MKLDEQLIIDFRKLISENDIIVHIYCDYNGRNKWNAICSAMDWIEVAVTGIDTETLLYENTNQASIRFITFVCCVDILWEGICQLYRVLYDTSDIPFSDERSIFRKEVSDNAFWKEIRAAFAAHTTNLDGTIKQGKEKRFASWSGGGFGTKDFSVIVYSSDPHKDVEFFDISFEEIFEFISKRYTYLYELGKKAEENVAQYCNQWRKKPILNDSISTLRNENKNRLENDYINYRLDIIENVLSTKSANEQNRNLLSAYGEVLRLELQEIKKVLQTMDLHHEFCATNDSPKSDYIYPNKFIFEPDKGMIDWAVNRLKEPLGHVVAFDEIENLSELRALVRAGWWRYRQS